MHQPAQRSTRTVLWLIENMGSVYTKSLLSIVNKKSRTEGARARHSAGATVPSFFLSTFLRCRSLFFLLFLLFADSPLFLSLMLRSLKNILLSYFILQYILHYVLRTFRARTKIERRSFFHIPAENTRNSLFCGFCGLQRRKFIQFTLRFFFHSGFKHIWENLFAFSATHTPILHCEKCVPMFFLYDLFVVSKVCKLSLAFVTELCITIKEAILWSLGIPCHVI